MTNLDSIFKSRNITLSTKVHLVKVMVFPVVMYRCELDYKESWALKNWCFWTAVLEKTLQGPLDCKEMKPAHHKGNQSWIFIGRTDNEAETLILWPLDAKNWLIGKDRDAGKDWREEETGTTEDEVVGWHHQCDGHSFDNFIQISLVTQLCLTICDPTDCRMPAFPVHHQLPELDYTHVYRVSDAIQPSPSPPAFNLSQHQDLF